MMVSYNPNWKQQNEERERKLAELKAQGVDVNDVSSLTSQGHHGYETTSGK
jgi:hypothetical protein